MKRTEFESFLEDIVTESATISKKDKDRLVENLADWLSSDFGIEFDDDEPEEDLD